MAFILHMGNFESKHMKILRFSRTPLPSLFRLNQAINLNVGVESRYVVLDPSGYVNHQHKRDLVWGDNREEILELVEQCDLIHLHNYLDLDSEVFYPINFRALWNSGKPIIRQFHSTPWLVARMMKVPVSAVYDCPIPKLVIPHYPERFFPSAKVVPNIVDIPSMQAQNWEIDAPIIVGYAPSRFNSARAERWDTKGYPETVRALKRVEKSCAKLGENVKIDVIEQVSHAECIVRKADCHISVDDLVTGSFHLSTLESLAAGSATAVFMDGRTLSVLFELTGRTDFPAVNLLLEDSHRVLRTLVCDRDLTRELGQQSHEWMKKNWDPLAMSKHYITAYNEVMENPGKPFGQRFLTGSRAADWRVSGYYDIIWENRQPRWPRTMPKSLLKLKSTIGKLLRSLGLRK